jgi:hypothetical protein
MLHPDLRLFVLLQNAWARILPTRKWSYNRWLCYLRESKTGLRLVGMLGWDAFQPIAGKEDEAIARRLLVPDESEVSMIPPWCWFGNTTAEIAVGNNTFKPDPPHVALLLQEYRPNVILACGVQARDVLYHVGWDGPAICIPHPAAPFLSDGDPVFRVARRELMHGPGAIKSQSIFRERQTGAAGMDDLPPIHRNRVRFVVEKVGDHHVMRDVEKVHTRA